MTRDISESISDDELYDGISAYLTELDRRSRIAADDFWTPSEIVKDPPSIYNELRLILEELSSYHLIETQIEMGDQGLWAARITPAGRHLLRNAKALQNDPDGLVAGVARSVTINNTTITGSTVGNLASGGTDVTFSGAMSIIQHPQAKLLESAFKDLILRSRKIQSPLPTSKQKPQTTSSLCVQNSQSRQVRQIRTSLITDGTASLASSTLLLLPRSSA